MAALLLLLAAASGGAGSNPPTLELLGGKPLAVGKSVPDLRAWKSADEQTPLFDGKAKWTVVAFLSVRCPCTARYLMRLNLLAKQFAANGVRVAGVNANANEARDDAFRFAREQN